MQLKNKRIGRSTNEAYATPWERRRAADAKCIAVVLSFIMIV